MGGGGGNESYVLPCEPINCFPRPFFTKNPWPNVSSAASSQLGLHWWNLETWTCLEKEKFLSDPILEIK